MSDLTKEQIEQLQIMLEQQKHASEEAEVDPILVLLENRPATAIDKLASIRSMKDRMNYEELRSFSKKASEDPSMLANLEDLKKEAEEDEFIMKVASLTANIVLYELNKENEMQNQAKEAWDRYLYEHYREEEESTSASKIEELIS